MFLLTSESLGPILSKLVLICVEFHSNRNAALRWDEPTDHYFACHFGNRNMSVCLTGTLNDSETMTTNPDSYWTINSKRSLRHRNDTFPSPKSLNLPQGETSMAPGLDSIRRYTVPEIIGKLVCSFFGIYFHRRYRVESESEIADWQWDVWSMALGLDLGIQKTWLVIIFWIYFFIYVGTMLNLNPTWFARRLAAGWDIDPWLLDWTVKNPRCALQSKTRLPVGENLEQKHYLNLGKK